jgi:chemosensory pili system protein ChpA (sensor histidine kinase/response regulator)
MPTDSSTVRPLVLVADPDVEYAALISRQLEWAGYGVIATDNGIDARDLIEEKRPDALVLEANLRDVTGYALVREVRAQRHNRLVPIVMISARAGKLDRDFAFTVGADEYVKKPFPCATIVARLALLTPALPTAQPIVRPRSRPRAVYAHRLAAAF